MKTVNVDGRQLAECEDCHKPIKPITEVPWGFVSPESSGIKQTSLEGKLAIEAVEKVVCRLCYTEAYKRFHPDAPLPELLGGDTYDQPDSNQVS